MDHYRVRDDVWQAATVRRDHAMRRWNATLADGVAALGADTPAGACVAEAREFFAFLDRELPALLERAVAGVPVAPVHLRG